jgi:hypothetical protein
MVIPFGAHEVAHLVHQGLEPVVHGLWLLSLVEHKSTELPLDRCDTPVSPRVSLKKPNQEPLFYVHQSKHEHQDNLSKKEFTKYMLKSVMIKTIESLKG